MNEFLDMKGCLEYVHDDCCIYYSRGREVIIEVAEKFFKSYIGKKYKVDPYYEIKRIHKCPVCKKYFFLYNTNLREKYVQFMEDKIPDNAKFSRCRLCENKRHKLVKKAGFDDED